MKNLPPIISWGIWLAQNRSIFQDMVPSHSPIAVESASIYALLPPPNPVKTPRLIREEQTRGGIPQAYFDGASDPWGNCGSGLVIYENNQKFQKASVGLGPGSIILLNYNL